jgi:hypothetical protein
MRYKKSDIGCQCAKQQQQRLANPYLKVNVQHARQIAKTAKATADPTRNVDQCNKANHNWQPPLFSDFANKKSYNGWFLSKYRVDSIVTSVILIMESLLWKQR